MFVHAVGKYEKAESVNTHNNYETISEKRTGSSCVYTQWKSTKKVQSINTQNDYFCNDYNE